MGQETIKKRVVGIDISLDATTYAIVDVKGDVIAMDSFPTMDYPEINQFISALSDHLVNMVEEHGGYESIRSVGISAPSANFMTGSIVNAPNLPWKGVIPLGVLLRDRIGYAVAVANNADVRALGEHAYGLAKGMRDFVVVTMGNGIGSCLFSNGMIHKGNDGFAGEIGHTCIVNNGRQCTCGNKGCLEAYVATRGIIATAKELLEQTSAPSLMRGVENLTPMVITDFCEQGDELAIEVYRKTGELLGMGLANYASMVDPEAFIFTGGLTRAGKWLFEPAQEMFEKYVFHNTKGKIKFLVSEDDRAANDVLGASVLAWEVREYSLFK
jgi:glucokinase